MKVLVIPDIHLKTDIFKRAADCLENNVAEKAVCLMDIPDDWKKQFDLELYDYTYDVAMDFARRYPDTLWCYGNHDLCYRWHERESGYSPMAAQLIQKRQIEFNYLLTQENPIRYVHKIDNVLFCHGGISRSFVEQHVEKSKYRDVDYVISKINELGHEEMWNDTSPIWLRPQEYMISMYMPRKCIQVVGHTPVKDIQKSGNVISCDVFSTYMNGEPIGCRKFLVIDTISWHYEAI